jgi:hypothetical protein
VNATIANIVFGRSGVVDIDINFLHHSDTAPAVSEFIVKVSDT